MVRVRFAPSPTGYLHVGGARTALFNWLYARHSGGAFILRIEDTDVERSSEDMVAGILEGMTWLGLDWDEGPGVGGPHAPYFQSGRLERYREMAEQLVRDGHGYYCYCTPEALKERRAAAVASGSAEAQEAAWQYDRTCLNLTRAEIAEREARGDARAIRFKVPAGRTQFDDEVHGAVAFDNANIEDFVVLRSDAHPTYHLSVVVDDIDMEVTHVVRGDDHVSNTPKQVMLYEAFGRTLPVFAHVPLILGPDKRRLSKRHGATSVTEYKRQGYLAEAMVNFLALLGWSPGNDREVFTTADLVHAFSLDGISSSNAVFNPEKLDWFNAQHILRMPLDELATRVRPILEAAGLWRDAYLAVEREWFLAVLDLVRSRTRKLEDFGRQAKPFLADTIDYEPAAVQKHLSNPELGAHLRALADAYRQAPAFDAASLEGLLRSAAEQAGLKAGLLIHATRVAVTGEAVSPGIFEVLALLGRARTVERLERAAALVGTNPS
ncbi:MAG: glutamate--tRNA ligase [Bacteroidales bacterium]